MGLLPYARRVASASRQRPPRDGGDGGGRRSRDADADAVESPTAVVGVDDALVDATDDDIGVDDVITGDVEEV
jgi:hypothetical protein